MSRRKHRVSSSALHSVISAALETHGARREGTSAAGVRSPGTVQDVGSLALLSAGPDHWHLLAILHERKTEHLRHRPFRTDWISEKLTADVAEPQVIGSQRYERNAANLYSGKVSEQQTTCTAFRAH